MSAASKITALLLTAAGTLTLGGAVLFGSAYGGLNGKGQGTATASGEPSGIIETDFGLGALKDESPLIALASSDAPPSTAIGTQVEAPKEQAATSPKTATKSQATAIPASEVAERDSQAIHEALDKTVTLNIPDTTLLKALKFIAEQYGIPIHLKESKEGGEIGQMRTSLVANQIPLRQAVEEMLARVEGKDLKFRVIGELLHIGDQVQIAEALRSYEITYIPGDETEQSLASTEKDPASTDANADIVEKVKQDTQKIRDALDRPTTFEFNKTPLKDALASMSEKCGINIKLDTEGLKDIGINEDTPIDMVVEGITLQSSLKLMLENVNGQRLDYILEDGALIVGSVDRIYRKMNERDFDDIIQRKLGTTGNHILKTLDDQVDFNLPNTTLSAGLSAIADKCGITIMLDGEGMKDGQYSEKSPVTLVANGIPMRAALSKMLGHVDGKELFYLVDGELLRVGTRDSLVKSARSSRLRRRFAGSPDSFLTEHDPVVTMTSTPAAHTRDDSNRNATPATAQSDGQGTKETETSASSTASSGTESVNDRTGQKRDQSETKVPLNNGASLLGDSGSEHRAPIVSAIRNLSAADRRVYLALDQTTRLEFPDNTIQEVFDFVADLHQINIRFDRRSLEDAGVNLESRLQCTLGGVSLRTALPLILDSAKDAKLDYYVDGGILFITTEDAVANKGCLRFYDLSSELVNISEVIAKYAQGFEADEPGTLTLTSFGDCLAIETSFEIHKKIEEMIVGVMQVAEARKAAGKELVIPKPKSTLTRPAPPQPAPAAAGPQQPAGAVGGSGSAGGTPAENAAGGFIGGGSGGFN